VESCCELGNEPSGSIKCWELPSGCTSCGLSSGTQLHRVSYSMYSGSGVLSFLLRICETSIMAKFLFCKSAMTSSGLQDACIFLAMTLIGLVNLFSNEYHSILV
jgi:hypothetical protein